MVSFVPLDLGERGSPGHHAPAHIDDEPAGRLAVAHPIHQQNLGEIREPLAPDLRTPGEPLDKDLYDLPPEEEKGIPTVAHSLDVALEALSGDREFLKAGGVMTDDVIDAYIELKSEEVQRLLQATHPAEFELYYSV